MGDLVVIPLLKFFFVDGNGDPAAGAKLYSYVNGTTTPKATYTDGTKGTPNTNPVILDSAGRADVWIDPADGLYRFVLISSDDVPIFDVDDIYAAPGLNNTAIQSQLNSLGRQIGEPFALFDNITGVSAPDNSGTIKFIKLTAGLTGAGAYNEGLLTNESVTGTAPLVAATAEIATGSLAGQTVHLMNSEGSFLRAGTTAGVLQQDQIQGHWHNQHELTGPTADFVGGSSADYGLNTLATGSSIATVHEARTDGTNGTVRFGTETRAKNVSATVYMRIV